MLKMIRIFRKEKFDLVQYSTPNASLYASLAAWLARVLTRLYCQWGIAYVGFHGLKRKIFKAIEKLVCTLSTWIEPDSLGNLRFSHTEGRPIWKPMHMQPIFKGSEFISLGSDMGADIFELGLYLPSDNKMTPEQQDQIIEIVKNCFA